MNTIKAQNVHYGNTLFVDNYTSVSILLYSFIYTNSKGGDQVKSHKHSKPGGSRKSVPVKKHRRSTPK